MAVNLSIFNSNKPLRFTTKIIIFLLILIIVDFTLGSMINAFYRKTYYGENWPKENWLTKEQYEIIVFGSSRAYCHYIPELIGEKVGSTVFNAGANGQYMLYAYALEQLVLEKYVPKIIILDLLPSYIVRLENPGSEFDRLSSLLPHSNNPEVKKLLTRQNHFQFVKQLSKLYRFNSRVLNIADNYHNKPDRFDNGYASVGTPKFRETNKFILDTMEKNEIDTFKYEILKKFITSASDKKVHVIMSFSPTLEPLSPKCKDVIIIYEELFKELDVPFVKILTSDYPEFQDKQLFMDYIHMNARGAQRFSEIFAGKLAEML